MPIEERSRGGGRSGNGFGRSAYRTVLGE